MTHFTLEDMTATSDHAKLLLQYMLRVVPSYYESVKSMPVEMLVCDIHQTFDPKVRFRLTRLVLDISQPVGGITFPQLWKSLKSSIILIRHHEKKLKREEQTYTNEGYLFFDSYDPE